MTRGNLAVPVQLSSSALAAGRVKDVRTTAKAFAHS